MSKELKAHFYVLLATFLVAGSFIVSQKLSGIIHPISITLYRFVIATLFLSPLILVKKKYREKIFSTFKRAMIISFFYTLFFIGMFKSLEYTSSLNTAAIYTLVPLITAFLSIFVFKQFISKKQYFIYFLGIIGTCMVVFKGSMQMFFSLSLNFGDILFLFSIISMALYSISAKYFYKKDDELLVVVFLTLIGGCLWMSFCIFIFDISLQWEKIEGFNYVHLFYLSIATTLLTVYLYQSANIVLGPKKIMSYVYLNPAAVGILLFVFEKVSINIFMLIGVLISSFATVILLKSK